METMSSERNPRRRRRSRSRRRTGEREAAPPALHETTALEEDALAATEEAVAELFVEPQTEQPAPATTGMQELLALEEPKYEKNISPEDFVTLMSTFQAEPELPAVMTPAPAEAAAAGSEEESPAAEAMPEQATPDTVPPARKRRVRSRSRKITALAEESIPMETPPETPTTGELFSPAPEERPQPEAATPAVMPEEAPAAAEESTPHRRRRAPRRRTRTDESAETLPVEEERPPVEMTEG